MHFSSFGNFEVFGRHSLNWIVLLLLWYSSGQAPRKVDAFYAWLHPSVMVVTSVNNLPRRLTRPSWKFLRMRSSLEGCWVLCIFIFFRYVQGSVLSLSSFCLCRWNQGLSTHALQQLVCHHFATYATYVICNLVHSSIRLLALGCFALSTCNSNIFGCNQLTSFFFHGLMAPFEL